MTAPKARGLVPAPRRKLGRYELISPLGVGGMARVYLALQRGPDAATKLLAIKQLRAEVASDEHFLTMFADEARVALRLSHPNVVHTYDVVVEPSGPFMVMELLQGQSLTEILKRIGRPRMPVAEHLWLLTQLLAGLHYAHTLTDYDGKSLSIVHRDVSPSNVFVTYTGEVKVLDFGIAKSTGARTETAVGVVKGKLGYASPEQCMARAVDARTDVYAVGVMLWEALAGRRRALAETEAAVLQARVMGTEPGIDLISPDIPRELVDITNRALAHDPNQRFASAGEMQRALQSYLARGGISAGAESVAALLVEPFRQDVQRFHATVDAYFNATRDEHLALAQAPESSVSPPELEIETEPATRSGARPGSQAARPSVGEPVHDSTSGGVQKEARMLRASRFQPVALLVALLALPVVAFIHGRSASPPETSGPTAPRAARTVSPAASPQAALAELEPRAAASTLAAPAAPVFRAERASTAESALAGARHRTPKLRSVPLNAEPPAAPRPPPIVTPRAERPAVVKAVEPGEDLHSDTARPSRQIDKDDPYTR